MNLGGGPSVECPRCGNFKVGDAAVRLLEKLTPQQAANFSGWISEHVGCVLNSTEAASLLNLRTPSVAEKADKLLAYLARAYPKPGGSLNVNDHSRPLKNLPSYGRILYGVAWCQDQQEFYYILHNYLIAEKNFVGRDGGSLFITPAGWAHLDSLQQTNIQSQIGFIAMWFDESMSAAWIAIDKGIRAVGYEPLRIDRKEHNNKIDDEIVAGIRRSKFLVADFTGHRGGVYFETGFATGLGLPVIWLCRKDELEKTHFDTRQYNFIVWEADKLAELSKALQNRIEATIGHGPLTGNVAT